LCFFCGIPGILQRLESLLQGGPLLRGQTIGRGAVGSLPATTLENHNKLREGGE
jgi:hypothetical protein